MSNLTFIEKSKLERQFQMKGGYVLDFSDRTFAQVVLESTGRDINGAKYCEASGSKANRLRAFWRQEPNHLVGKLTRDLLEHCRVLGGDPEDERLFEDCQLIAVRLLQGASVDDIDAITPEGSEWEFEVCVSAVRNSIERNEPEAGLDRLHTYVTKLLRTLSERHGIITAKNKPLHSVWGEYVKQLRQVGLIESEMTERILKSSISVMEAFNHIRNDRSLAHDNAILNYDESLLIFNHVCNVIRFIRALEARSRENSRPDTVGEDR